MTGFLNLSTSMTLNDLEPPKEGFWRFFGNFWLQRIFQPWTATKWLKIDQDNLRTGAAMLSSVSWALLKLIVRITASQSPLNCRAAAVRKNATRRRVSRIILASVVRLNASSRQRRGHSDTAARLVSQCDYVRPQAIFNLFFADTVYKRPDSVTSQAK